MSLQTRVMNILTKPASEWLVIATEPTDVVSLYKNYIAILAAIPAVCLFVMLGMIGMPFLGRLGLATALTAGVASYISSLVSVYIAALVIEKLGPTFKSSGDTLQALKLVAYAYTPVWIAGVFYLLIFLSPLMLVAGLYAIYLFYVGLTPTMKTPQDQTIQYMVVSALVIICVSFVLRLLVRSVVVMPYGYF